jgi:EAL domain-containing protein (putative c-di-GMP-specific phosphodiesterase class I)
VSLSVGISIGPRKYDSAEQMLRDARTAMHRAKVQGRARYEVFDHEMLETVEEAIHLETELFQALEARQLKLSYQPVVRLGSGAVVGFEALTRWEHPDRGAISPGRFISLAEETGLIVPLSRWLFEEAFARLKQWQERFDEHRDLSLSVNLSPKYLFHPDLESDLAALLRNTGIDPGRMHLEITESSFIDRPGAVAELLCRLKKWGFRIALDDFGTGYSSLSILHELPFDILKIDQAFTSKIVTDPDVRTIVGSIVGLTRKLGLDVVAEGIETPEQLEALRKMRCSYGQGSLLGSPMAADAAQALLSPEEPRARLAR